MTANFDNKDRNNTPFMVCFSQKEAMELLLSLVGDEDKMPSRLFEGCTYDNVRRKFVLLLNELLTTETDQSVFINYNKDGDITHE